MAYTIFYSWQSDISPKLNRNFIEVALKKAIKKTGSDITVQEALRDARIELDKDTKDIPGMPPIVDTILSKISSCGIFIPDLTFVGKTDNDRYSPNPNVLIEYGWALREVSHSRIVPVMNTAFGEPSWDSLPFDMRHLRHPIRYNITDETSHEDRKKIKIELTNKLARAIELIITSKLIPSENKDIFSGYKATSKPSTFLMPGEKFLDEGRFHLKGANQSLPDNQHLFLRLIPSAPGLDLKTSKQAIDIAQSGGLRPLSGDPTGHSYGRNKYGSYVCYRENDEIQNLTQLFKNGELWGIDAYAIDKDRLMKRANVNFGFLPASYIEKVFHITLNNYLKFVKDALEINPPLKLLAGASDVEGYRIAGRFGGFQEFNGNVVEEHLIYESIIENYEKEAAIILKPFFEYIWEEGGLERPDKEILT